MVREYERKVLNPQHGCQDSAHMTLAVPEHP